MMLYSVISPRALPVILALSVGHLIGVGAFACYLLAVILDAARKPVQTGNSDAPKQTNEPNT
jgi:hypothetical protein